MKYQAILFDLDGTVLNTLGDLLASLNAALGANGYPHLTLQELEQIVGNGIRNMVKAALPAGTEEKTIDCCYRHFCQHYETHCMEHTKPYEGILPLLQTLRDNGYRLCILSNKADAIMQEMVRFYFPELIEVALGERAGIARKPSPEGVEYLLQQLRLPKEALLYVGDSDVDVKTAVSAGLDGIFVTWGFRSKAQLLAAGATRLADTPEELLAAIRAES